MLYYDNIINKYQGKGIPYRDRSDDIRWIVLNLCAHMSNHNEMAIRELIVHYKCFSYIKDVRIEGNNCTIEYDCGVVTFNVLPSNFLSSFSMEVFGFEGLSGQCHYVTQKVLESCHSDYISAITSLCINSNYLFYFHSYVYDKRENKIIDFSRNFIMDKDNFDKLFCFHEINDLNYNEYKCLISNLGYDPYVDEILPLLYLALDKLEKSDFDIGDVNGFSR